jgi:hypothetical protein
MHPKNSITSSQQSKSLVFPAIIHIIVDEDLERAAAAAKEAAEEQKDWHFALWYRLPAVVGMAVRSGMTAALLMAKALAFGRWTWWHDLNSLA